MNQQDRRPSVGGGGETAPVTSLTIRGIERDLERTPSGRGGIIRHDPATKGIGGSGTPGDNLLADWRELEAALAAERDRADRAESLIANAPHSLMCEDPQTGCTCWKSEATA